MMAGGQAFGAPGIPPTWTSSAKDLVTTALGVSRVWITFGYGIVNEVYWPATGEPQVRDLGFILARDGRWIELKRANRYRVVLPDPSVPVPRIVHEGEDYRFTIEIVPDPRRDVVLIAYTVEGPYDVHVLLAPHLGGSGLGNSAWVDGSLFAECGTRALALAAGVPFAMGSAGFVGASDGWQDFNQHGRMAWAFDRADAGNVALMGALGAAQDVLALGFAESAEGAHTLAVECLADGFDAVRDQCVDGWRDWSRQLVLPAPTPEVGREAGLSAAMLKVHEDRAYPGAMIASLSIPWGNSSDSRGGYHLVWPRDAVEAALALEMIGRRDDALRTLHYLAATQQADGHWFQNFYPDGQPFWQGIQLDETGLPILLAARLAESGVPLSTVVIEMIRRAAAYLARTGPMSPQDRWEENEGANPFTLAVEVAALVAAAEFLDAPDRAYAVSLADYWNARIEDWCYVTNTDLARRIGVPGYYVRIATSTPVGAPGRVEVRNRAGESLPAAEMIGLEFAYLARLGLRRADTVEMRASRQVADAVLRVDTPSGPLYHRYNSDGYGEHEDGRPFDGTGIGRAWPLLTGEMGHLAMLDGDDPLPYLETMIRTAGPCGLLPEQAWDAAPIPERGLFPGQPSGSAMPLVWAHGEFLKLLMAREAGRPCERLRSVESRYDEVRPDPQAWHWRDSAPFAAAPPGKDVVVEDTRPFALHVWVEGGPDALHQDAEPLGLGVYGVRLAAAWLAARRRVRFTRRYADGWEGVDHEMTAE
jgi:glucoamylase